MAEHVPFLQYPPTGQHGVIGDRRTAALVAADGTVNWLCLPDFDGPSVFGALLDSGAGGYFRFGPTEPFAGSQVYLEDSAVLVTTWSAAGYELELTDLMLWPEKDRAASLVQSRVIVRRARCLRGRSPVVLNMAVRPDFGPAVPVSSDGSVTTLQLAEGELSLWTTFPVNPGPDEVTAFLYLAEGQEAWAILGLNQPPEIWTTEKAGLALDSALDYWREWQSGAAYAGPDSAAVRRSAMLLHLLNFAPCGSIVAAPVTSLPLEPGGSRNYDYRYSWVRDVSLALSALSLLGKNAEAENYISWLVRACQENPAPLKPLYRLNGQEAPAETERDLAGYQESRPVRMGHRNGQQFQASTPGYLLYGIYNYLEKGGSWSDDLWPVIERGANEALANWREPDNGFWELEEKAHYVSSKVLYWTALDRGIKLAEKHGHREESQAWQAAREELENEILARGWSEEQQSFRQRYDEDGLDASLLLIPLLEYLPGDDYRVIATLERIVSDLTGEDGLVRRFPAAKPVEDERAGWPAAGNKEPVFLPATFWLAQAFVKAGLTGEAEQILARTGELAGNLGLLAGDYDLSQNCFLGNMPLAFAHAEHLAAALALAETRPLDKALMRLEQTTTRLRQLFKGEKDGE